MDACDACTTHQISSSRRNSKRDLIEAASKDADAESLPRNLHADIVHRVVHAGIRHERQYRARSSVG